MRAKANHHAVFAIVLLTDFFLKFINEGHQILQTCYPRFHNNRPFKEKCEKMLRKTALIKSVT